MSGTNSSINNTLKLPLKGLVTSTNSAITSTDRVIDAFGKLQAQITSVNTGTGKLSANQTWSGVNTFSAATNSFTNSIGIGTTAPTHSLTLSSTSTGWTHYNTVDQTTNFERVKGYWNSNAYELITEQSGTGQPRALILGGGGSYFSISNSGSNGHYNFSRGSGISQSAIGLTGGISGSATGFANGISLMNTINQSGTAGYRAIYVSPYEQTTGSGSKLLLDLGINTGGGGGGTHTSRFSVASDGGIISSYGRVFNTGNWFLGSSPVDAGFRLDVNGSSRVQGNLAVNSGSGTNTITLRDGIISKVGGAGFTMDSIVYAAISHNAPMGVFGTGVGNNTAPTASSVLELISTNKGFLPPRGSNSQMNAIVSPAEGLVFFDTTNKKLNVFNGTTWEAMH